MAEEIAELRQQGIEVDDDNEPAPENAAPPVAAMFTVGTWVTPTVCPRKANAATNNHICGSWRNFAWSKIKLMDELEVFRMAMPEEWVVDVVLPATNEIIDGEKLTLQDFYCFLGCHFFMCCFEGISDRNLWWSPKAIAIDEGAPFRLNNYMSL